MKLTHKNQIKQKEIIYIYIYTTKYRLEVLLRKRKVSRTQPHGFTIRSPTAVYSNKAESKTKQ
jgi:hypothetical protein